MTSEPTADTPAAPDIETVVPTEPTVAEVAAFVVEGATAADEVDATTEAEVEALKAQVDADVEIAMAALDNTAIVSLTSMVTGKTPEFFAAMEASLMNVVVAALEAIAIPQNIAPDEFDHAKLARFVMLAADMRPNDWTKREQAAFYRARRDFRSHLYALVYAGMSDAPQADHWIGATLDQRRPYTFAKVTVRLHDMPMNPYLLAPAIFAGAAILQDEVIGLGFSKVSRPDTWDAEYGCKVALRSAIRHIVAQISPK